MELTVPNPFGELAERPQGAAARALQARESTEVLALLYGARSNPRDPVVACERIKNSFTRLGLAEQAEYQYARGGTNISGPSIRAAEAIRLEWGNMAAGWRELARRIGPDGVGESEVEAYCLDLETNNREAVAFQVRHWRDTKRGGYKLTDERDVYELLANQAARRKRACILAMVPGDVVEMAMEQAGVTLRTKADTTPEGVAKMVEAFARFGVRPLHIEQRIQRGLDAITPGQIVTLKRIWASLRDQMSAPGDWFRMDPETPASSAAAAVADVMRQGAAEAPGELPARSRAAFDSDTYRTLLKRMRASDVPELVLDEARDDLTPDAHAALAAEFEAIAAGAPPAQAEAPAP